MKILTKCDKCNSGFSVEEKLIGRKGKCPKCGEVFIVHPARGAIEPQKPNEAAPASTENSTTAKGESDVYRTSASDDSPRCPTCQKPLAPGAVICMNCGYDLRTGVRVQYHKYTEQPEDGGTLLPLKRRSDGKSAGKRKKKTSGIFTAKRLVLAGVLFAVLAGSIGGVWGALALYRNLVGKWNQHEALLRLDYIFSEEHVNGKKLAQELPYIFAYQQQYPARFPKVAPIQEHLFLDAISRIPEGTDLTPLLEFPPNSPAYQPIFDLINLYADLSWRIQKSCDSSDTARYYGADLLMAWLPFNSWTEADKNSLRERTDVDEKQRRFRKYADQSQLAAEQKLPGRYRLQLEAMCSGLTKDKGGVVPSAKERKAETPNPVFEVTNKNKSWNVSFFGRAWTGPIEQFAKIDLACPIKEHRDLFAKLPFFDQHQEAEMHLRFKNNEFVVELKALPLEEYMTEYQIRMIRLFGFTGFKITLIKAAS